MKPSALADVPRDCLASRELAPDASPSATSRSHWSWG
jgi:hypothetical protein